MTLSAWLAAVLSLGASIYLGLAFTLVFLLFPGALATTHAANFPERFGDPVRRAVALFAGLSVVMLIGGGWLTARDWDEGNRRLLPLSFTVLVVLATAFTVVFIVPVNRKLYRDIPDQVRFTATLRRWMTLNVIRSGFWLLEWLAITGWFVVVLVQGD